MSATILAARRFDEALKPEIHVAGRKRFSCSSKQPVPLLPRCSAPSRMMAALEEELVLKFFPAEQAEARLPEIARLAVRRLRFANREFRYRMSDYLALPNVICVGSLVAPDDAVRPATARIEALAREAAGLGKPARDAAGSLL